MLTSTSGGPGTAVRTLWSESGSALAGQRDARAAAEGPRLHAAAGPYLAADTPGSVPLRGLNCLTDANHWPQHARSAMVWRKHLRRGVWEQ